MKTTQVFAILLVTVLIILGYAASRFVHEEAKETKEIKRFEKEESMPLPLSPLMSLGYGRGKNFSPELKIKPDIAALYKYSSPLALNEIGLKGVWFVERDRITSLGDNGTLGLVFQAKHVIVKLSGQSPLPVRVEIDGQPVGEVWVEEPREYDITLKEDGQISHRLTLYVPRNISAYSFRFTE